MKGSCMRARTSALIMGVIICVSAFAICAPKVSGMIVEHCSDAEDLPSPRIMAGVVSIGNSAYVIGGFSYSFDGFTENSLDTVLIYDTVTGDVTYGAPMPNGTANGGYVVGSDGLIYSLGGWNDTLGGYLRIVQIYDPVANSWSLGANSSIWVGGCDPVACADGRILIFGPSYDSDNSTLIYDTVADEWSYGADQPSVLWLRDAAVWNETAVYVMGGRGSLGAVSDLDVYNPVDDTWDSAAAMPAASCLATCEVVGDSVYYIGGTDGNWVNVGTPKSTIIKYDPGLDSWSGTMASLPTGRCAVDSAMDSHGRVFVIGGYDGIDIVPTVSRLIVADVEMDKLEISAPSDGSIVSGVVTVEVAPSNFMAGFDLIELYIDDALYETRIVIVPWESVTFSWDTTSLDHGTEHELLVRGYTNMGEEKTDSATVTVWSTSVEERLAELETDLVDLASQLAAVEAALSLELEDQAADLAALQSLVTALQSALDALAASVSENDAEMAAELAALQTELDALDAALVDLMDAVDGTQETVDGVQDSLDDLQGSLNETQDSVDDVQSSVDNKMDGALGLAIIGLLVVVILLMVIMMLMGRKPKAPTPLPEPPPE